jgi:CubicO group peptidase (beta-lactamase class C family)
MMKPDTARLMIRNHNGDGIVPRGLGFSVGRGSGSPGCSEKTYGHSGSSGTLAWADPATDTVCVVLTTLPGAAAKPHPLRVASDLVAKAVS